MTVGAFLTPHPAWNPDTVPTVPTDPCAEFFNKDGSLADAAYEFLHREWSTGRMA